MSLPLCACGRLADKVPSRQRIAQRERYRAQGRPSAATFIADEPICNRCLFLDGPNSSRYDVVAALRDFGRLMPIDLARITGLSEHNISHLIRRMRQAGRIELIEDASIEGYDDGKDGFAYRLTPDRGT